MNSTAASEPSGLFVPYKQASTANQHDLCGDRAAQASVKRILKRVFDLDFSMVQIDGFQSPKARSLTIVLWEGDDVVREVTAESSFTGNVYVKPRQGCSIFDAMRNDQPGKFRDAWLTACGYEADYPACLTVDLDGDDISFGLSVLK